MATASEGQACATAHLNRTADSRIVVSHACNRDMGRKRSLGAQRGRWRMAAVRASWRLLSRGLCAADRSSFPIGACEHACREKGQARQHEAQIIPQRRGRTDSIQRCIQECCAYEYSTQSTSSLSKLRCRCEAQQAPMGICRGSGSAGSALSVTGFLCDIPIYFKNRTTSSLLFAASYSLFLLALNSERRLLFVVTCFVLLLRSRDCGCH